MCCYANIEDILNLFFTSLPPTLGSEPAAAAAAAAAAVAAGWQGEEGEGPSQMPLPAKFVYHYSNSKKNIFKKGFFYFTSGFSDNQSPSASISHTVPFFGGTFLQKYLSFSLSTFSLRRAAP